MPLALTALSALSMLAPSPSTGARLVTRDGRELPLIGTSLRAEAAGGVARTVLEQRFRNPHAEPLAVTYSLPLPADGAVSGFAFVVGGRRIEGEVEPRAAARDRYERALLEGRSAALLEHDRTSLFTQEIGNVPPGATVVAEITVDQPLLWLDEGQWEWRFPTVVSPRYLGEPGRVPDAERVTQDVSTAPLPARFTLACTIADELAGGREPESPSHAMTVTHAGKTRSAYRGVSGNSPSPSVTMRVDEGARLDRDIVVRWAVATPEVGLSLSVGRPGAGRASSERAYGLLTIVPPEPARGPESPRRAPVPRDLVVLLDTSGSMAGEPLAQAARVTCALIDTLGPADQLELLEFSDRPRRFRPRPLAATPAARAEAIAWVRALRAGGATDMQEGVFEALATLRSGAQRQVVVITDGQIGFESQIVLAILQRLPGSSRLHMVGVGPAVNRSLTHSAARAGRGCEILIGLGEDPERAAARLVARTAAPVVVDIGIAGSALTQVAPHRLPDLFAGAPARIALALRPEGGKLVVRGHSAAGMWEQWIDVPSTEPGEGPAAPAALFARERVEDLETSITAGANKAPLEAEIEHIGVAFRLATRLTSWIAVTREVTVDRDAALVRERMPHELPHGVSAEGLGLRPAISDQEDELTAAIGAPMASPLDAPLDAPLAGPLAGPAPPPGAIDACEDLGGYSRPSRSAPSRDARLSVPVAGPAPRARCNVFPGAFPMIVGLLAFAITFWLRRSFGVAFLVSTGAILAAVLVQLAVRKLLRSPYR